MARCVELAAGGRGDPAISAVIVTPDRFQSIRRTARHLAAQTASDRLELVVVAPSAGSLGADSAELGALHSARVVQVGPIETTGRALAAGVRQARAPIVVCAEEHSYPEPGWAGALIEAHAGPWAAVGVQLMNANPDSIVSWVHLFSDFGQAVAPAAAGEAKELPGHHTAYKRDVLLECGSRLPEMLEQEWVLHDHLKARGERLYLEARATSWHLNVSRLSWQIRSEYEAGRMFGAARARLRDWSVTRRALYVLGSPLLPVVRMVRALRHVRRSGRTELLPRMLPALAGSLLANSVGQVVGYAAGGGEAARRRQAVELRRHAFLNRVDRRAFDAWPELAPSNGPIRSPRAAPRGRIRAR